MVWHGVLSLQNMKLYFHHMVPDLEGYAEQGRVHPHWTLCLWFIDKTHATRTLNHNLEFNVNNEKPLNRGRGSWQRVVGFQEQQSLLWARASSICCPGPGVMGVHLPAQWRVRKGGQYVMSQIVNVKWCSCHWNEAQWLESFWAKSFFSMLLVGKASSPVRLIHLCLSMWIPKLKAMFLEGHIQEAASTCINDFFVFFSKKNAHHLLEAWKISGIGTSCVEAGGTSTRMRRKWWVQHFGPVFGLRLWQRTPGDMRWLVMTGHD